MNEFEPSYWNADTIKQFLSFYNLRCAARQKRNRIAVRIYDGSSSSVSSAWGRSIIEAFHAAAESVIRRKAAI